MSSYMNFHFQDIFKDENIYKGSAFLFHVSADSVVDQFE